MTAESRLYDLIVEIRGAFRDLRALSDRMNADHDITAAMRAVMEHVAGEGPATVPQIAEAKKVSRQNIQLLADGLVARGLAEFRDNPAHKRSKLLQLTAAGRSAFDAIRQREEAALAEMAGNLDLAAVEDARRTLAALRARIAARD